MSAAAPGSAREDFAREKVPDAATISPGRVILIVLGVSIALPAFIMGAQLGTHLGLYDTLIACALGGAVLGTVAALSAVAGAISRVSSYVLIIEAFGHTGGKLINMILGAVALAWFGVVAMMFGSTARAALAGWTVNISALAWSIAGCVLFTATTVIGFRAINRLSVLVTPLKALLLVWTVIAAVRHAGHFPVWTGGDVSWPTFAHWSSFVIGGMITGAVLMPDLSRYVRTPWGAIVAAVVSFGVAFPLVLLVASIPAILTGEQDLVAVMVALGLGLPALLIVILATWTTASFDLYIGSLTSATLFARVPRWRLTVFAGVIGSALGLMGISERLVPFLILLSVAVPPIGGVFLCRFYLGLVFAKRHRAAIPARHWHLTAFGACIMGAVVAVLLDHMSWRLTTFSSVDSILIAAAVYLPLQAILMTRPTRYERCSSSTV